MRKVPTSTIPAMDATVNEKTGAVGEALSKEYGMREGHSWG
ncbi:hypothetical protein [Thermococcus celericrescens]|nr:hypothetical protein [Thermococcus celericrescens]